MKCVDESVLDQWRKGRADERVAVYIWEKHVEGKEPGTTLPAINHLIFMTQSSLPTVVRAKKLLGAHGVLMKENRRWVVA